jgi:hypothetical protein
MDQFTPEQIAEIASDRLKNSPAILSKLAEFVDAQKRLDEVRAKFPDAASLMRAEDIIRLESNVASTNIRLYGANTTAPVYVTGTGRDDKATGDARLNSLTGLGIPLDSDLGDAATRFAEAVERMQQDKTARSVLIPTTDSYLAELCSINWAATLVKNDIEEEDDIDAGIAAERTRILTALQSLKPRIRPSHGDWARAWREEAALDMWNKVVALVAQEAPKGE